MAKNRTNTAEWLEEQRRWQIKVQRDGVRRTFTSSVPGRAGQREANQKADAWLSGTEVRRASRLRVGAAIDIYKEYMADLEAAKKGDIRNPDKPIRARDLGNARPVISLLETWMRPRLGRWWLDEIGDGDLQQVLDFAAAAKKSRKTIKDIKQAMISLIKYHRKAGATSYRHDEVEIPAASRYKGKRILQPEDVVKVFTLDETVLRGKRVKDQYIHAYRLQILTGLRPGEMIGLDVQRSLSDLSKNVLHIWRSINIYNEETQGKNKNAIRDAVLSPMAKYEIVAQLLQVNKTAGSLFEIESEATYRKRFKRYCESNDIPYISPYEMRHTFVSIAQKLPEGELKALVGHSKAMDTFGVYGHDVKGYKEDTAARLQDIFNALLLQGREGEKKAK